jgi:hypothetical protein
LVDRRIPVHERFKRGFLFKFLLLKKLLYIFHGDVTHIDGSVNHYPLTFYLTPDNCVTRRRIAIDQDVAGLIAGSFTEVKRFRRLDRTLIFWLVPIFGGRVRPALTENIIKKRAGALWQGRRRSWIGALRQSDERGEKRTERENGKHPE